jgi:hypothetical protein
MDDDLSLSLMAKNDAQRDFRAYMRELKDRERGRIPPVTLSPIYDYRADKWDCAEDDYSEESFP